jgi:AcrR family transcriptional regulator
MSGPGRRRDASIDAALLVATQRQLAELGYEAVSLAAIAEEAGTTRQALYRRYASKADLATAAIAAMSGAENRANSDDPFADLVRELESFRSGVARPNGMSMIGTMLQTSADPELVSAFRERLVAPRRARLSDILRRGIASGALSHDADVALATSMLTGSWYSYAVAGARPPKDWPRRVATLIWRALQPAN